MTTNSTTLETPSREASKIRNHQTRLILAFAVGVLGVLLLASAAAYGYVHQYDGKIVPGVHSGSVDLGGLSRSEARSKLTAAYASLATGKIDLVTSTGPKTITYAEVNRRANVDAMLDQAFAVARGGNPLSDAVDTFKTGASGVDVPVSVALDTEALAHRIRSLATVVDDPPVNATVKASADGFTLTGAVNGHGVDEPAAQRAILAELVKPLAPQAITVQAKLVPLVPDVTDEAAAAAVATAERMAKDVTISDGSGKWTIAAKTVRTWLSFSSADDGRFGPVVDHAAATSAVAALAKSINKAPVEATFLISRSGEPVGVTASKDGRSLNAAKTGEAVARYVEGRAAGTSTAATVSLVVDVAHPKTTSDSLSKVRPLMQKIGSWTTHYDVGPQNCYSRNITIPAQTINGTVVAPGAVFSFWGAVGPVTTARGYCDGGVIKNGRSYHTGALGGGICSASTTMFNAALRAGYQMGSRANHYYYITRYPIGLDATVFMDGGSVQDMTWTNDTAYPVLIRGYGSPGVVTFEVWSVPNGRHVSFSSSGQYNIVYPGPTQVEYTTALAPGAQTQAEYPTTGFDIDVYRKVTDSSGRVIHSDHFYSHYSKVDGLIQIGTSAAPATPKPTPPPSTKPSPTPTPAPTVKPSPPPAPSPSPH